MLERLHASRPSPENGFTYPDRAKKWVATRSRSGAPRDFSPLWAMFSATHAETARDVNLAVPPLRHAGLNAERLG